MTRVTAPDNEPIFSSDDPDYSIVYHSHLNLLVPDLEKIVKHKRWPFICWVAKSLLESLQVRFVFISSLSQSFTISEGKRILSMKMETRHYGSFAFSKWQRVVEMIPQRIVTIMLAKRWGL